MAQGEVAANGDLAGGDSAMGCFAVEQIESDRNGEPADDGDHQGPRRPGPAAMPPNRDDEGGDGQCEVDRFDDE